jgi:hypothetical protein
VTKACAKPPFFLEILRKTVEVGLKERGKKKPNKLKAPLLQERGLG